MKKILVLGTFGVFALASCTKDYSCKCTYTVTDDGFTTTYTETYDVEGASSTQAQAACNEATITYTEPGYTQERTCELK